MENIENMTEALPMLDNADARGLAEAIAEVLDSKKGKDIKVLHVEDKTVTLMTSLVYFLRFLVRVLNMFGRRDNRR